MKKKQPQRYIVVSGNPVDGLEFWGVFDSSSEAVCWADEFCEADDWWVAKIKEDFYMSDKLDPRNLK